jgi:aspartyl protease family protein
VARPGSARLRDLLYVVAAFLLIYLLFSMLLESPAAQVVVSERGTEVVLQADRSGHFRGKGTINGVPVEFLVDTGASYLAIPHAMAERLRLQLAPGEVMLETAAGRVAARKGMVERVAFSVIEQRHVAAVVVPGLEQPLLGMNFLRRLSIHQKGGTMVMRVEQ